MKIAIFGANGPTGRQLTAQALSAGHEVTAIARNARGFPLENRLLRVVGADVYDTGAVDGVIAGQDAVLSSLGVPYSRELITVYSEGVGNITRAMARHGVSRIVAVSSSLTDPSLGPHGGFLVTAIAQPLVAYFGRSLYADMARMETQLRTSELDWTVMRPSGLFDTAGVTDYRMSVDYLNGSYTSRADLAAAMLYQLSSEEYLRKFCAVATFDEKPSLIQLIAREGSGKKAAPETTVAGGRA